VCVFLKIVFPHAPPTPWWILPATFFNQSYIYWFFVMNVEDCKALRKSILKS